MNLRLKQPDRISDRSATRLAVLFLLLLPAIFFWRETLGWATLANGDIVSNLFPIQKLAFDQIRSGAMPLWNPQLYSGMPLFAQLQQGLLDPLNWIYLFGVTSRALTLTQELSFMLSLLATFAFARSLGLKRRAGVLAAVIYALSGFALTRSVYPGHLRIYALTPLLLLFIERLRQTGRWREAAFGSLIITWQLFAGHPQPFVYSLLLAAGYAIFRAWVQQSKPGQPRSGNLFLMQCGTMFVLGLMLAAVQLLPSWELSNLSVRQQASYEFFTSQSLHPISLLNTLFPFFHGQGKAVYQLPHWGVYWTHNEGQFYLGAAAIALAVAAAVTLWRDESRQVKFWSIAGLIALLCALGKYVMPLAWLLYRVPFLNSFRSPNRHWMEVALAIAMLAGFAVDRLLRNEAKVTARAAQFAAGLLSVLCVGVAAFSVWQRGMAEKLIRALPDMHQLQDGFLRQAASEFYVPAITAIILGATLIVFARAANRQRWYPLLLALMLADCNLYATFAPINNRPRLETAMGQSIPPELLASDDQHSAFRYHLLLGSGIDEFSPYWFAGHEMATGYDPLLNRRYKTFSSVNEAGRSERLAIVEARDRTLDLLNVRYLVVPPNLLESPAMNRRVEIGGIAFAEDQSSSADLQPGESAAFATFSAFSSGAAPADILAIVSSLSNSIEVADGEELAEIVIGCESGATEKLSLLAGRDASEWAFDRADVRPLVKHSRATVAESWEGDERRSFQAHSYLARLKLPAASSTCSSVRFVRISAKARNGVTLSIKKLAFYDSASKQSSPLAKSIRAELADTARWREVRLSQPIEIYGKPHVFENLRAMPRVWLAQRIKIKSDDEQLRLIRGEKNGAEDFNPQTEVLIEAADALLLDQKLLADDQAIPSPEQLPNSARILSRTPNSMAVSTESAQAAMLVMSEIAFPGWRARIDGNEAGIVRVNYLLRGVPLPAGQHTVELVYRPRTLFAGAAISLLSLLCLMLAIRKR